MNPYHNCFAVRTLTQRAAIFKGLFCGRPKLVPTLRGYLRELLRPAREYTSFSSDSRAVASRAFAAQQLGAQCVLCHCCVLRWSFYRRMK